MIELESLTIAHIKIHARKEFPRECCGVIAIENGEEKYFPCFNISKQGEHFILNPKEYANIEEKATVIMIVHSHCGSAPELSEPDRVMCGRTGLPWLIINWPTGIYKIFESKSYIPNLVGRKFCHGILDCYSIIADYYEVNFPNLPKLPDPERRINWWKNGENLYLDNYKKENFIEVSIEKMQKHDVLLMTILSKVPNHGAIYLGENKILHHVDNRLSSIDVYGGYYRKNTTHCLRRQELII